MQKNNNDRIAWIDIARGIGIFLVVLGHCISPSNPANYVIYCFHMPLFFILSGYGFNSTQQFYGFIKKKSKALLFPYISTIALLIVIWSAFADYKLGFLDSGHPIYSILYGSGRDTAQLGIINVGPIWFLLALFSANIIFWTILHITKGSLYKSGLLVIILAAIGKNLSSINNMPWSLDIALVAQLFMFFGYIAKRFDLFEKIPDRFEILICGLILAIDVSLGGLSMNDRTYSDLLVSGSGAIAGTFLIVWLAQTLVQYKYPRIIFSYLGQKAIIILCLHLFDFNKILGFLPTIILYWLGKHGIILVIKRLLLPILFYNAFKYALKPLSCINGYTMKPSK